VTCALAHENLFILEDQRGYNSLHGRQGTLSFLLQPPKMVLREDGKELGHTLLALLALVWPDPTLI